MTETRLIGRHICVFDEEGQLMNAWLASPHEIAEYEQEYRLQQRLSSTRVEQSVFSVPELRTGALPCPPFIIKDWLPAGGMLLLYGEDGVGKSFVATTLASCLAEGRDFLGFEVLRSKVVYIQIDMTPALQQDRVKKQEWLSDENLFFVLGDMNRWITQTAPEEAWVKRVNELKPDVIIFDTLRQLHNLNEDASSTPGIVYRKARSLFGNAPALVFLHHTRKEQPEQWNVKQGYRGSSAWRADVDTAIMLRKHRGKIRMSFPKHRTCEDPGEQVLEINPLTLNVEVAADDPTNAAEALIRANPDISRKDFVAMLRKECGVSQSWAYELAERFVVRNT